MDAGYVILGATTIFSGGGLVYMVRRMRKDMNGIGKLAREIVRDGARRYHNVGLAVMAAAPEDKKTEIAALLREEG